MTWRVSRHLKRILRSLRDGATHIERFQQIVVQKPGMRISTDIAIPGRAEAVWAVLTDLPSYQAWNPFIRKLEGALEEGAAWRAELTIDGRLFFTVPTVVTQWVPGRRLAWRGGIPRLMTGAHGFSLTETADGVTLEQSESFSGALVPAVFPMLRTSLTRRFIAMNDALRSEVVRRGGV